MKVVKESDKNVKERKRRGGNSKDGLEKGGRSEIR